jgi:hypothetical protein
MKIDRCIYLVIEQLDILRPGTMCNKIFAEFLTNTNHIHFSGEDDIVPQYEFLGF